MFQQRRVNHQINIARTQNQREKARTNILVRFDNLPTFSGQKGEDLIQPTVLQIDPKIQIRETTHWIVELSQINLA